MDWRRRKPWRRGKRESSSFFHIILNSKFISLNIEDIPSGLENVFVNAKVKT
jgi:hypothetical protein